MPSFSALTTCVKYLLFFFNLLFVITGIIIISVGAVVQGQFNEYVTILDEPFRSIPAFLIAIGVLIFIIAFFGCCGAIKENYCMILTFSILMVIIFILELAAGISGFVLRDQTYSTLNTNLKNSMDHYNTTQSVQTVWDNLQRGFECCGTQKPEDWNTIFGGNELPMSCCPSELGAIGIQQCNITSTHYKAGCLNGLSDFISSHAASIGAAGVCIGIIQFIGILFSCHLAKRTKYENAV